MLLGVNREADGLRCVTGPHNDGLIVQIPLACDVASDHAYEPVWANVTAFEIADQEQQNDFAYGTLKYYPPVNASAIVFRMVGMDNDTDDD